jgi:hypothetical protein
MMRAIDALAMLGKSALADLEKLVIDAPAKDPSRGFGIAMVLGSFEGRDGLAAIERVIRHLGPAEPGVSASVGAALKLVPHPEIEVWLRTLLHDPIPELRALAIDVMGHRGLLDVKDVDAALASDEPLVIATALERAAALKAISLAAVTLSWPFGVGAPTAEDAEPDVRHDPMVIAKMPWAMMQGGLFDADERLERALGSDREDLVLLPLAIGGELSQAKKIFELAQESPTEARITALGYLGLGGSLPFLVSVLRDQKNLPVVHRAAATALQKITGADLFEEVDLPPESLETEDPADPPNVPDAPRLARTLNERDQPSNGSPDRMRMPPTRARAGVDWVGRGSGR